MTRFQTGFTIQTSLDTGFSNYWSYFPGAIQIALQNAFKSITLLNPQKIFSWGRYYITCILFNFMFWLIQKFHDFILPIKLQPTDTLLPCLVYLLLFLFYYWYYFSLPQLRISDFNLSFIHNVVCSSAWKLLIFVLVFIQINDKRSLTSAGVTVGNLLPNCNKLIHFANSPVTDFQNVCYFL